MKSEKSKTIILAVMIAIFLVLCMIIAWMVMRGQTRQDETNLSVMEDQQQVGEQDKSQKAYNEVRPSIVKIDMGEHTGSGVILSMDDERILIVSSGHLLTYYESGVVTFSTGGVAVGWVTGISEHHDVGFMECFVQDIPEDRLKLLCAVNMDPSAFETLKEGDSIFQVGSTTGVAADYYEGTIASLSWYFEEFDDELMYLYGKVVPGMSGGGTFTENGEFIGLISGSYLEESCSIPLPYILEALEEIQENAG